MTIAEELAQFVQRSTFEDLAVEIRQQLKIRILDSLGCAIGAVEGEPVRLVRAQIEEFGRSPHCRLIGGGSTSPEQAAFYNSALVRYLDFNDSFLAKRETCHPSDNLGAVLAAAEYAQAGGKELMTALAVAYQVQCRLSEVAPVRARGFDHTTQGAYAVAAGVSKALALGPEQTANAIAISGTAFNALRVTRTGPLSNWKGLAYPSTAHACTYSTFLAMRGITGPSEVFEGNKGFMDAISGRFEVDWSREGLDRAIRTIVKRYNAEVHSQSVIEAILEWKDANDVDAHEIEKISIEIFDVAFHIIGGGEEGDKKRVQFKEEADHSLPYLVAVAILDGGVMPEQYRPERIHAEDVQRLLQRVFVRPREDLSRRFPEEMPCRIEILMRDGKRFISEKNDYEGFHTRPMRWETVVEKFETLSRPYTSENVRREIVEAVSALEFIQVRELLSLLSHVQVPGSKVPEPDTARPVRYMNRRCHHDNHGHQVH